MVVEKDIGGKPVFLSYLPAGSYFGEMAVIDGSRARPRSRRRSSPK
jgi:cGMP-dependent protein kinase 2